MKWESPLVQGMLLKRYKRFFADVEIAGSANMEREVVVAHVANTGSLKGALSAPQKALMSKSDNPARKLAFSLQAIQSAGGAWIGVNTSLPRLLVEEAFSNKLFKHWKDFSDLQAEVKISKETRLDFKLTGPKGVRFIEVKNVTMLEKVGADPVAQFPDGVTERGQKHLRELMALIEQGHQAEIFFLVQRDDAIRFRPADQIDPEYGKLLREAKKKGVIITVAVARLTPKEAILTGETLPVDL